MVKEVCALKNKTLKSKIALVIMLILTIVFLGLLMKPWKIKNAPSMNVIDTSIKCETGSSIGISQDIGTNEDDTTSQRSKASSPQPTGESSSTSQRTVVTTSISKTPVKTELQRREYVLPEEEPAVDRRYDPPKKETTSNATGSKATGTTSEHKGTSVSDQNQTTGNLEYDLNIDANYNVPPPTGDISDTHN